MSTQQSDIQRTASRKAFHNMLKETVGVKALETLPSDSKAENIPEPVSSMLSASRNDLSISATKYICATQESLPVSTTSADPQSIWVGWGGVIPRWKKGQVIQFAVFPGSFPTPYHAAFSAYKLNEAAIQWNSLNIGVTFKWVSKLEDAAFVLAYGGDKGTTYAQAFFPNSNDLNTMFVYQRAFNAGISPYQTNIFLHELGHVLGLRHEFAALEGGAVQFGPANPLSVMSYTFPPNIRDSDETSTRAFYNFTGGQIGNLKIQDWIPDN